MSPNPYFNFPIFVKESSRNLFIYVRIHTTAYYMRITFSIYYGNYTSLLLL